MTRPHPVVGWALALALLAAPGLAGMLVTALTGPDRLDAPAPATVTGEAPQEREASPWTVVRVQPRAASRSVRRAGLPAGTLNWHALAMCESTDNPRTDTGNGYYGLYQFDLPTWASVGGHGNPAHASRAEQTYRAQLLYADRGRQPWPVCGRRL